MQDRKLFESKPTPIIDIKGIFERAAGHPAEMQTRTIVCGDVPAALMDTGRTLSGKVKPGAFSITPTKRTEQFFV